MADDVASVKEHIQRLADELAREPFEQIEAANGREEQFTAPSGRSWRLKIKSYWNRTDEAGSARKMDVTVAAYGPKGWRSWWPYRASARQSAPD